MKLKDVLNATEGVYPPWLDNSTASGTSANTKTVGLPSIGDIEEGYSEVYEELGRTLYTQLITNGQEFDPLVYPELAASIGGSTLPVVTGDVVPFRITADNALPPIGMIYPSKNEKLSYAGVEINDLILCDEGSLDTEKYPLLAETLGSPNISNEISRTTDVQLPASFNRVGANSDFNWVAYSIGGGYRKYDKDWNLLATYNTGHQNYVNAIVPLGSHLYIVQGSNVYQDTLSKRDFDNNEIWSKSISGYNVQMFTDGIYLYIYNKQTSEWNRYDLDGEILETGINNYAEWPCGSNGEYIVIGDNVYNLSWELIGSYTTDSNRIAMVLGTSEVILGVRDSEDSTILLAYDGVLRAEVFLPANTSPYPDFPDRIVADLTED